MENYLQISSFCVKKNYSGCKNKEHKIKLRQKKKKEEKALELLSQKAVVVSHLKTFKTRQGVKF